MKISKFPFLLTYFALGLSCLLLVIGFAHVALLIGIVDIPTSLAFGCCTLLAAYFFKEKQFN